MNEPIEIPWSQVQPGQRIALSRRPDTFNPAKVVEVGTLAEISRADMNEPLLRPAVSGPGASNVFRMEGGIIRQFTYWIACEPPA